MRIALGLDVDSTPSFAAVLPVGSSARPRPVPASAAAAPASDSADAIVSAALVAVDAVTAREGESPSSIAVAYPLQWDDSAVQTLRRTLDDAELGEVSLLSSALAAAIGADARLPVRDGRRVTVIALRPGGAEVLALRKGGDHAFRELAPRASVEGASEAELDAILISLVAAKMPGGLPRSRETPAIVEAMETLNQTVHEARLKLCSQESAVVGVRLPGRAAIVQVQREEFELAAMALVSSTVPALVSAIRRSGEAGRGEELILIGAAAPTPLLAALLADVLGIPVHIGDPRNGGSMGAALLAAVTAPKPSKVRVVPIVPEEVAEAQFAAALAAPMFLATPTDAAAFERRRRPLTLLQLWPITAAAAVLVALAGAVSSGALDVTPVDNHPRTIVTPLATPNDDGTATPAKGIADTERPTAVPTVDAGAAPVAPSPHTKKKKSGGSAGTGSTGTTTTGGGTTTPTSPSASPSSTPTPTDTDSPTPTPTPTDTDTPTPTPSSTPDPPVSTDPPPSS